MFRITVCPLMCDNQTHRLVLRKRARYGNYTDWEQTSFIVPSKRLVSAFINIHSAVRSQAVENPEVPVTDYLAMGDKAGM